MNEHAISPPVCILVVTFGLVLMAHERFERQNVITPEASRAAE